MKRLILIAALLCCAAAWAIDTGPAFDDPALQERYENLIRELRCLVCRSESIADSNAQLASDLRRQTRELMAAGKSDAEILKFMSDRYGDYVLYQPPVTSRTLFLWATPALLCLAGLAIAVVVIRRKSRMPIDDPSEPDPGVS